MAQINNFDGGLSIRRDPSLIRHSEAQRLVNVDLDPAILCSAKSPVKTDEHQDFDDYIYWKASKNSRSRYEGKWFSFNKPTYFADYAGILYYANEDGFFYIKKDLKSKAAGVSKPPGKLTTTIDSVYSLNDISFSARGPEKKFCRDSRGEIIFSAGKCYPKGSVIPGYEDSAILVKYKIVSLSEGTLLPKGTAWERDFCLTPHYKSKIKMFVTTRDHSVILTSFPFRIYRLMTGYGYREIYTGITDHEEGKIQFWDSPNYTPEGRRVFSGSTSETGNVEFRFSAPDVEPYSPYTDPLPIQYKLVLVQNNRDVGFKDYTFNIPLNYKAILKIINNSDRYTHLRVYQRIPSVGINNFRLVWEYEDKATIEYKNALPYELTSRLYTGSVSYSQVLQYTATWYNKNADEESPPMDYSDELNCHKGDWIRITDFPKPTDSNITHYRLYRMGGYLTSMTRIAEIPIANTKYIDKLPDISAKELLDSYKDYPAPKEMLFFCKAYGLFFGLVKNEVIFSKIGVKGAWPKENSFELSDNGTGILPIPQGILLFTENTTEILLGTKKSQFSKMTLSNTIGCVNGFSCKVVKNFPLWVSHQGICTFKNGNVETISKDFLGRIAIKCKQSVVFDDKYIVLCYNSDELIVLDLRSNFRFYTLNIPGITGIWADERDMYAVISRNLYKLFDGDLLTLDYLSPVFVESNHSICKVYSDIYIRADGEFTIEVFIDGNKVLTENIEGNTTHTLKVPSNKQRGYGCSFGITGVGRIYTIDFKVLGRQNGR